MDKKYVVAYGKTLSTKKGIKDAGEPVDVSCFLDEKHMLELEEKGFIQAEAEFKKMQYYSGRVVEAPKPAMVAEENPPTPEPPKVEKEPLPELKLGGAKKAKK